MSGNNIKLKSSSINRHSKDVAKYFLLCLFVLIVFYFTMLYNQIVNGNHIINSINYLLLILLLTLMYFSADPISKDKKALSTKFDDVIVRKTSTIVIFNYVTFSLYILYYTTKRYEKLNQESKTENKNLTEKNQDTGQQEQEANQHPNSLFFERSPDLDFTNIAGMAGLKSELREKIIHPLENNGLYSELDIGVENGILLYGPPGTGKTHAAKCLAGELNINFAQVSTAEITSKFLGEGVENIRELFAEAREKQPALVFLDEIDAIATDRSNRSQHHDRKQIVSQLLQELSDIEDQDIIVIGATNNPDAIDDAILRTGRFDSKIKVPKPGFETRAMIFTQHLHTRHETIDANRFKEATNNFTASDLVHAAELAARNTAQRIQHASEPVVISEEDIFNGIESIRTNQQQLGEFVTRPPQKDFRDVAGMDELKNRLGQIVIKPIENKKQYEKFGVPAETGVLLHGPPGTGKTHISECLAGELNINYINCRVSDITSKWSGEGAKNIHRLFSEARQHDPCLIFLDELDAVATDRSGMRQNKSQRQMVNQLLQEMSTLYESESTVIVLAATNRSKDIDSAILRTGRFSEKIEVPPPNGETRVSILRSHLDAPTATLDIDRIEALTDGFVASDMVQIATEAARHALQRSEQIDGEQKVVQKDVEIAIQRVK